MIYIVFATVALIVIGIVSMFKSDYSDNIFLEILGAASLFISFVLVLIVCFTGYSWVASDTKAKIINREYGTHYTREEVFYADDIIDTIQQIKRKRIELNGNIMKSGKGE
jgi:hypothetical protein